MIVLVGVAFNFVLAGFDAIEALFTGGVRGVPVFVLLGDFGTDLTAKMTGSALVLSVSVTVVVITGVKVVVVVVVTGINKGDGEEVEVTFSIQMTLFFVFLLINLSMGWQLVAGADGTIGLAGVDKAAAVAGVGAGDEFT